MSRNKDDIVRHSGAELQAMKDAGKTQTDWKAAAQMPLPDGSDPDDAMEHVTWATTELPMPKRKEHTNLRIDAEVLAFFREQGKGYQTKINAVLRSYVEQATKRPNEEVSPKKAVSYRPAGAAKKVRKVDSHHPAGAAKKVMKGGAHQTAGVAKKVGKGGPHHPARRRISAT